MEDSIALFRELVSCGVTIYTWVFDARGQLVDSNCPDQGILSEAFEYTGSSDELLGAAQKEASYGKPILLGSESDLVWGADFQLGPSGLERCVVIGPVFFSEQHKQMNVIAFTHQSGHRDLANWNRRLGEAMRTIPVVPSTLFLRDVAMLHYCLTREKISLSEVASRASTEAEPSEAPYAGHDRRRVYMAEQALLGAVRNGDLDYQKALTASSLLSSGVPVSGRDRLRQIKTSNTVFISLVVRAAMEGGLSPEVAYPLGDAYIQQAENSTSVTELMALGHAMYDDFIRRVHEVRTQDAKSEPVRVCCDYIEAHLDEKITAETLAKAAGYSSYYLTRIFHEELGMTVTDYVRRAKVERAKVLLRSTDKSVADIAAELHFSSRSYFCRIFNEVEGTTPGNYREQSREPSR